MKDMIDRLMPPGLKSPLDFSLRLPAFEIATLKNGVQVYQVNGGAEDVIKIDWVFEAGNVFENKNSVAAATRELINSGTSNKSAYDISNQFEYYGAYYSTAGFSENAVITVNSLTKHIGDLLPVVREILTDAVFPEEEVALYKQNRIQRLKVYLKKSEFLADRLVNEALFGADHPYGRKVEIEDIEKIDRESLIAFYKSYFQEGNCRIFVSGKFTEKVVSLLNEFFGDLKFTSKKKIDPVALHPMKE
ncbi:MAG TPA: insulinase family protein, partial [Ginsengibacter sp.]|nr:insulinase family protein [Ginsengibacter sp.]